MHRDSFNILNIWIISHDRMYMAVGMSVSYSLLWSGLVKRISVSSFWDRLWYAVGGAIGTYVALLLKDFL